MKKPPRKPPAETLESKLASLDYVEAMATRMQEAASVMTEASRTFAAMADEFAYAVQVARAVTIQQDGAPVQ